MQNKLYDIYPVWHVPFWQTAWFFWALMFIVCAVLCIVGWQFFRWFKARRSVKTVWDQALCELASLQKMYPDGDQGKEFYLELTRILKKYLHGRYGFDVYSKTDQETLDYLAGLNFNPELIAQLRAITDGSVMIKFANVAVIQEQMKRDLESSIFFIKQTIPSQR